MKIIDVAHVMFNVTDMERALKLYCDVLGFTVSGGYNGEVTWLNMGQFKDGSTQFFHDLGLYLVPNPAPPNARKEIGRAHV